MEKTDSFGTCCACGEKTGDVWNFIALPVRAPEPGTGWGCMICKLPMNGALAVVCDKCLAENKEIKWVIKGPVWLGGRIEKKYLVLPFDHKPGKHEQKLEKTRII